ADKFGVLSPGPGRRQLLKGKPTERWGRKVTGLTSVRLHDGGTARCYRSGYPQWSRLFPPGRGRLTRRPASSSRFGDRLTRCPLPMAFWQGFRGLAVQASLERGKSMSNN